MNARKSILSTLTGFFSREGSSDESAAAVIPTAATPPVDLDEPVTNPALVAAIYEHQQTDTEETAVVLLDELKQAVLLVGITLEKPPARTADAEVLFKQGDRIGVIQIQDDTDRMLLALFTDHAELQRFTDEANSTLVMPTRQAMEFVLRQGYHGLVINPASDASVRLDAAFIHSVVQDM